MLRVLLLQARRDRITLPLWVIGTVLIGLVSANAVVQEYGGPASRAEVLRVALATPSLLALRGAPNGGSLGSTIWFQVFTFLAVVVGLLNTFLAVRHGRGDEEHGRRELLAAQPIGRAAPLAATAVLGIVVDVALGILFAAGFAAMGLPVGGAVLAGAALAVTGLAFLGPALLIGELTPTSRSANGIASAVVLLAYALRGAGDALGTPHLDRLSLDTAWPSWLSPIGWGEQVFPFTADRPGPLLLSCALFALPLVAAVLIRRHRDLGWSLLQQREGRPAAGRGLAGPFGLAWRLQWPAAAGWVVGAALLGAVVGSLASAVRHVVDSDPQLRPLIAALGHGGGELVTLFVAAVLSLVAVLAAAGALQATLRLHEEEATGRTEALLATPLSRARWLLANVGAGWLTAVLVVAVTAVTTWAGLTAAGEGDAALRSIGQSALQLPAAVLFAGLAAVLVAVLPRGGSGAAWALFGVAAALAFLGPLVDLPDAVLHASPFSDVPIAPVRDWTGTVVLVLIDLALPALAALAYRRRGIPA